MSVRSYISFSVRRILNGYATHHRLAVAIVGCKQNEPETPSNQGAKPGTTDSIPAATDDVPEGYVDILIEVPDGEECHGI